MTTTSFIDKFLRELPNYITCIPSDMISNVKTWSQIKIKKPFFVVNLSPSHVQNYGHWVLVIIHSNDNCELFDSLALSKDQLPIEILQFLSKFGRVRFSSKPIQSPLSNFCGVFVIARALSVYKAESAAKFYKNFHKQLLCQNDIIATQYILDSIQTLY